MTSQDDAALLALAADLAERAGTVILDIRARGFAVDQKADLSPVTEADQASEVAHRRRAAGRDARTYRWWRRRRSPAAMSPWPTPAFWLVDPLDGTREFTSGNDEFAVNIGLVRDNRVVLGVVGVPALGELFGGIVGQGAWKRTSAGQAAITRPRAPRRGPDRGRQPPARRRGAS